MTAQTKRTNKRIHQPSRFARAIPLVLIFAVLSALILATIVLRQQQQLATRTSTPPVSSEPVDHVATHFEIIETETDAVWNVTLNHRCRGEVKYVEPQNAGTDDAAKIPYCLGTNTLSVSTGETSEEEPIIDTRVSTSANDAPTLARIDRIRSQKTLLITYDAIPCTFSDDSCGVGVGYVGANIAYNVATKTSRILANMPGIGTPVWNTSGTKALFPVVQVGGAGCDDGPIVGYDLLEDTSGPVTDDAACEFEDGIGSDVEGNPLPEWGPVFWTSDDTFTAILLQTDGTVKQIVATF